MKQYKVLIVEDNPKNMKLMVDLIGIYGYEPITASDGLMGIESAKKHRPDLILMDIQLPHMDGYSVIENLKEISETKDIPIIVVTSFAMKGEEARALEMGAVDYLSKPINIHILKEKVNRQLPVKRCEEK